MNYLLTEILLCLLIAGLIGFVIGWLFRGGCKKKNLDNTAVVDVEELTLTELKEAKESSEPELLKEARNGKKDNLSLIKGIGKVLEGRLNDLGIYHLDQVAVWNKEQQMWIDANLSLFKGRVEREKWVTQAKELLLK